MQRVTAGMQVLKGLISPELAKAEQLVMPVLSSFCNSNTHDNRTAAAFFLSILHPSVRALRTLLTHLQEVSGQRVAAHVADAAATDQLTRSSESIESYNSTKRVCRVQRCEVLRFCMISDARQLPRTACVCWQGNRPKATSLTLKALLQVSKVDAEQAAHLQQFTLKATHEPGLSTSVQA